MSRSAIIVVISLVCAALPWTASGQDCEYYSFKLDVDSFAYLDEPIPPYEICFQYRSVGTLNGRYVGCIELPLEFRTSDDIWGDGWDQLEAWKFYVRLETKKGVLEVIERSWIDTDFGNETGILKVIGGTGAFDGAFGTLSYMPGFPNNSGFLPVEGVVCTP